MTCQCVCHTSSGSNKPTCSIDNGYSGIVNLPSCSPCNYSDQELARAEIPDHEACVMGHDPKAKRYLGLLCRRHYANLADVLTQIVELWALRSDVLIPGPGGDGRGSKRVHSPAPGRLEVMALTDRRAVNSPDDDPIPDVPGTLNSWVQMVVEERGLVLPGEYKATVSEAAGFLQGQQHWLAQHIEVDDYLDSLHDLHRAVARAIGDTMWPKTIGPCPNCTRPLFNTIGLDQVTCTRCGSVWDGVHLARLRLILERAQ